MPFFLLLLLLTLGLLSFAWPQCTRARSLCSLVWVFMPRSFGQDAPSEVCEKVLCVFFGRELSLVLKRTQGSRCVMTQSLNSSQTFVLFTPLARKLHLQIFVKDRGFLWKLWCGLCVQTSSCPCCCILSSPCGLCSILSLVLLLLALFSLSLSTYF